MRVDDDDDVDVDGWMADRRVLGMMALRFLSNVWIRGDVFARDLLNHGAMWSADATPYT